MYLLIKLFFENLEEVSDQQTSWVAKQASSVTVKGFGLLNSDFIASKSLLPHSLW